MSQIISFDRNCIWKCSTIYIYLDSAQVSELIFIYLDSAQVSELIFQGIFRKIIVFRIDTKKDNIGSTKFKISRIVNKEGHS